MLYGSNKSSSGTNRVALCERCKVFKLLNHKHMYRTARVDDDKKLVELNDFVKLTKTRGCVSPGT